MPNAQPNAEVRPGTARDGRSRRWLAALVFVVLLLVVLFTVYQAVQARAALQDAEASMGEVRAAVTDGDTARAEEALAQAQDSTAEARDHTHGPVWWLGSRLPGLGDDVSAVRTVTEVGDDLTRLVLPGLVEASGTLSPAELLPRGGRIDVDAIEQAAPAVVQANQVLGSRVERVAAIDTDALIGPLAGPVAGLQDTMIQVGSTTEAAAKAVQLLPSMLGSQGPRSYLVLFQNNAEVRATGGIPGAFAVMNTDDGRIEMGRQGTARDLGFFEQPVLPLTRDEVALYDPKLAAFAQDITFTPDFPRSAQIAQEMWRRSSGTTVDGVLSTDPVGLSYVLDGTGPVDVAGRELTAGNAVELLLNDVYMNVDDPEQQNAFFAQAAREVFDAVTSGRGDPRAIAEGVTQMVQDDRLLVWSAHPGEQSLLADTPLAGALPEQPMTHPAVGVYFNDGTGAKMDYYLDYDVTVESLSCDGDGRQRLRVGVTMKSTAPPNAASLPESVIGPGFGAAPGTIRTNLMVYAPFGGSLGKSTFNGDPFGYAKLEHDGRPVAATTVDNTPGEEHHFTFEVTSGPGQPEQVQLRVTPGAQPAGDPQVGESACA